MNVNMHTELVYYSTYTKLAYDINEEYYHGIHYAWCCPFFFQPGHPPSSTPKEIYSLLSKEVRYLDRHSAKIRENASGIMKGARFKMNQGIITPAQFQEIKERVNKNRQLADFKPVIFIIPATDEVKLLRKSVGVGKRAANNSKEFIIEQLPRTLFDVISLED